MILKDSDMSMCHASYCAQWNLQYVCANCRATDLRSNPALTSEDIMELYKSVYDSTLNHNLIFKR